MAAVPGDIDTATGPPTAIPLRHFVVGFGFLLAAAVVGVVDSVGIVPGMARAGYRHLLLAGWVCLTILGAMTQFVPVWSGVSLHSQQLATAQLWLTAAGVAGLATGFLTGFWALLLPAGAVLLCGIWTFIYNLGRTLARIDTLDVTEQHFAIALCWFALLTPLGISLASGLAGSVQLPLPRSQVVAAHVTVGVFGAVLTTVIGALYQLATMFTQTELGRVDRILQDGERVLYPLGVLLLAGGRLFDSAMVASAGGILVAAGLGAVSLILGHRLVETSVEWTPMLRRYAVVAVALAGWAVVTVPAWFTDPLSRTHLLGTPAVVPLLLLGGVGFVVLGTLYHVVPFIIWVNRYSDRLGLEPVPMIDDLYNARLAVADLSLLLGGVVALLVGSVGGVNWLGLLGTLAFLAGGAVFVTNLLLVLHTHSNDSLSKILRGHSL